MNPFLPSVVAASSLLAPVLTAQDVPQMVDDDDALLDRLDELAREQAALRQELEQRRAAEQEAQARHEAEMDAVLEELDAIRSGSGLGSGRWYERMTWAGYGEHHFNFLEGDGGDLADIHRWVLFTGYRFNDWIQLAAETEIEHAFVNGGNGDLVMEQLYSDLLLDPNFNVRLGRVVAPLGIINKWHEPPIFNGVERPNVEKYIIPTTWSLDGAGVFGRLTSNADYELYLTGSLDGSGFSDTDAIRGGRIKERPSLNDPALSGRIDWRPFANSPAGRTHNLRVGGSFFHGGYDNGNKGVDPGLQGGDVSIVSVDAQYGVGRVDLRGVWALGRISNAENLNNDLTDPDTLENPGVGGRFSGYYVEAGYHCLPDSVRTGKLSAADLIAFVRYEKYDTQEDLPVNAIDNPASERDEVTIGLSFLLTRQFVLKADYQILDDETADGRPNQWNLGVGWMFQ